MSSTNRQNRQQAESFLTSVSGSYFPNSTREFLQGSQPDIHVPFRRIHLSETLHQPTPGVTPPPNLPVDVYDTSSVYGDPNSVVDVKTGLKPLRSGWISARAKNADKSGVTQLAYARRGIVTPEME
ncbi:MAG: phosphomethylpyrimidine synthase ThiC, partial [Idiomarina piscisalsi]|nr:phosphomethylpyrimidine synthase ThiC [Idiomarina piscisalsi]